MDILNEINECAKEVVCQSSFPFMNDIEKVVEMDMKDINKRINQEVCYKVLEELTDKKLMFEYINCDSVKNRIKKLSDILKKNKSI